MFSVFETFGQAMADRTAGLVILMGMTAKSSERGPSASVGQSGRWYGDSDAMQRPS
jgi:hypothetical protein